MKPLRLAIATAALQVLALAYLAGQREWIVRTGTTVYLRTAPFDPRDVMRGDYVRLDYEISRVPRRLCRDGLARPGLRDQDIKRDLTVYASLKTTADGVAELTSLSDRKPASGLFLRGRTEPFTGSPLVVRYGLEAFFMEQGKGLELENQRSQGRRGVPLNMEVAVGANGIGVIKGYRWESLGINLTFDSRSQTNFPGDVLPRGAVILAANVELKNHGPAPVAILDVPGGRSFGLVCDARWLAADYQWVGETNAAPAPTPADVILLQPGQSHKRRLDLTAPRWFVVDIRTDAVTRQPMPLQQLSNDWSNGFRIEYRPSSAEACARLPDAKLIWHGGLKSRWFNPVGSVD